MAKKIKFKEGDSVWVKDKPNQQFKLVYYRANDATCGITDGSLRYIEKVKNLTLNMDERDS
jgi:hypothetical protein